MLSVIVCTHNPRRDYLLETIESLRGQALDREHWEFLLIDNASDEPLARYVDLSWHPLARCIREDDLGLTPARLRGVRESRGELLVFVDDDNILDPDYLGQANQLAEKWPTIGAFGGSIAMRLETSPGPWFEPYRHLIACREVPVDRWSNLLLQFETVPLGAGMCVRRSVADRYALIVNGDPRRQGLGRKGTSLFGSEDHDMAFTACDIGMGTAVFASLRLTHLIPSRRLKLPYLLKLAESSEFSVIVLNWFRGNLLPANLAVSEWCKSLAAIRNGVLAWRFRHAKRRGRLAAAKLVKRWSVEAGETIPSQSAPMAPLRSNPI